MQMSNCNVWLRLAHAHFQCSKKSYAAAAASCKDPYLQLESLECSSSLLVGRPAAPEGAYQMTPAALNAPPAILLVTHD